MHNVIVCEFMWCAIQMKIFGIYTYDETGDYPISSPIRHTFSVLIKLEKPD